MLNTQYLARAGYNAAVILESFTMSKSAQALLLLSLYWAQGLPAGLMTQALPVLFRAQGLPLSYLSLLGLLMLPWAIKPLWAPWVDRVGHYRQWIKVMQGAMLLLLVALAAFSPALLQQQTLLVTAAVLLLALNFAAATQDLATDAWAVRILGQEQLNLGNSMQVLGMRLGFIIGGGFFLWMIEQSSWAWAVLFLALLLLVNSVPLWYYGKHPQLVAATTLPAVVTHQPQKIALHRQLLDTLKYFYQQPEGRLWLVILALFKVSDGLSGAVLKAMAVDAGLSLSQIAWGINSVGALMALLGAVTVLIFKHPRQFSHALMGLLLIKTVIFVGYVWVAYAVPLNQLSPWFWYSIHAVEELLSAMLLVLMFSLMMRYSRAATAASDFSMQVTVLTSINGLAYIFAGVLAQYMGYAYFLTLCLIASLVVFPVLWPWSKLHRQRHI